jgi:alkaline phosphatase D
MRVVQPGSARRDRFVAPAVADAPLRELDEHGLGLEKGNLAAIASLKIFRTLRWGGNVELILTDNRSFRSQPVADQPATAAFQSKTFPYFIPQDVLEVLDAGRAYGGGQPLAYRVVHRAKRWAPGTAPRLERTSAEDELPLGS